MTESTISGITEGLRVMITAGAAGIGRVMAETFQAHSARVHICDVSSEAIADCRASLPDVGATLADVGDVHQVDRWFDEAQATMEGLDVLVNNAGIAGPTAGVEDIAPEEWNRTVSVNLNGQFYCARRAVPLLRKSEAGSIINISSVAGRLGYAYRTPYAATKWAVVGFTQSLAKELGPEGIRANAILPGVVEGERIERVITARAETVGVSYAEIEEQYLNRVSLRRMVTQQDIANMALFLCSPAGRNISGQALSVCGNVETL